MQLAKSRSSEVHLRAILDGAPNAFIAVDFQGQVVAFNRKAEALFGLPASAMQAQASALPEPLRGCFDVALKKARAGQPLTGETIEIEARRADGQAWVAEANLFSTGSGEDAVFVAYLRDITGRKQAEAAVRDSEERLRFFIENAPASIAQFDRQMRYIAVSRRWLKDYGLDGYIIGLSHYEVFPEISEAWKDVHRRTLAGKSLSSDGDLFQRADGAIQWVKWEALPWRKATGEIGGILISSEDITDRKMAEAALAASEQRYRSIYEHTATGISVSDLEGRFQSCNPAYRTMLGYTLNELLALNYVDLIHPEDQQTNAQEIRRLLAQEIPSFEIVNRYIAKGGKPIWVHKHISLLRDTAGKPTHITTLVTDVTKTRQAEDALRASEQRLKRIFKSQLLGLVYWNMNGDIVDANDKFLEPDSKDYVAFLGLGSVSRLSMTEIMASLAKPSAMMARAS